MQDSEKDKKAKLAAMLEEAKKKLSPAQMQQLMQMQKMMQGQKKPQSKAALFLSAVIKRMQGFIAHLDSFIKFIVKKEDEGRSSVIQATRAPIVFGVGVILVFVVIGGIWSVTAPLNSATFAIGTVIPVSNKQLIQAQIPDGGAIIKDIFVRQGDEVIKNDKLIEFDDLRFKTLYEARLIEYRNAIASRARLIAQRDEAETIEFPEFLLNSSNEPEVAKLMQTQTNLFISTRQFFDAERGKIKKEIERLQKDIEGLNARKVAMQKSDDVVKEKIKNMRKLIDKGFAQKANLLELEAKEAEIVSQISVLETQIIQSEQNITKQEIELLGLENRRTSQTLEDLQKMQVAAIQSREQFSQAEDALNKVTLRSPVHGIVNMVSPNVNKGGVVNSATALMEITPLDDSLVIEAQIMPKDIESIHVGLEAKIRFSAYKSRTMPMFTGKVISISPDTVDNPQRGDPRMPSKYYVAKINVDMERFNEIARSKGLSPLQPGMQAEVQIITGTRTLLRYITAPITDIMFKGFNEK